MARAVDGFCFAPNSASEATSANGAIPACFPWIDAPLQQE
jgi:hypothetical protein